MNKSEMNFPLKKRARESDSVNKVKSYIAPNYRGWKTANMIQINVAKEWLREVFVKMQHWYKIVEVHCVRSHTLQAEICLSLSQSCWRILCTRFGGVPLLQAEWFNLTCLKDWLSVRARGRSINFHCMDASYDFYSGQGFDLHFARYWKYLMPRLPELGISIIMGSGCIWSPLSKNSYFFIFCVRGGILGFLRHAGFFFIFIPASIFALYHMTLDRLKIRLVLFMISLSV